MARQSTGPDAIEYKGWSVVFRYRSGFYANVSSSRYICDEENRISTCFPAQEPHKLETAI